MKFIFSAILIGALALGGVQRTAAQSITGLDSLMVKRDSLEREIRKRVLTPIDKQDIRRCNQDKLAFLRKLRAANPEVAVVDSSLRAAKLKAQSPDDPESMRLMERKYSFEKSFEEAYLATSEGQSCGTGEVRRRKQGDAALLKDREYEKVLRRIGNRDRL